MVWLRVPFYCANMNTPKTIYLDLPSADLRLLISEQIASLPGVTLSETLPADLVIAEKESDVPHAQLVLGKGGAVQLPVRLGAVTDQIRYLLSTRLKHAPRDHAPLPLGPFMLHAGESTLHHTASGAVIRLTDKERLFLQTLHAAPGQALDRKTLLDTVWDYAEGVETHTLETHLYRLRQKLEVCGEAALVSSADGIYKLKI